MPYFKTSDAAAIDAFQRWGNSIETHQDAAFKLAKEVGANPDCALFYKDKRFAAFIFDDAKQIQQVPSVFIRFPGNNHAYVPRANTREGKLLWERIKALPRILSPDAYTRAIGFSCCFISGMRLCEFPATVLHDGVLYFMVPDEASYTPPEHVTEILGSEYNQAMYAEENQKK